MDPMSLTEEFVNILSTSVVAVRVNARIVLHSTLYAIYGYRLILWINIMIFPGNCYGTGKPLIAIDIQIL